jgi:hypothetical protein
MALSRSANGGIARHVRDGTQRERAQSNIATRLRGGPCGFCAGMARTDHNHIEFSHQFNLKDCF